MMKIRSEKKSGPGFKLASLGILAALLSLAMLLYAGPGFSANRYGLMVGIDHYDPSYGAGDLSTCINDANGFRNCLLQDTSRWNASNITTLTDSSATKSAIRSRLSTMAGIASSGELVVYFQSSHGGNTNPPTVDGAVLCSYNANYTAEELASDLSKFANDVSVIIVLDACYSGGMIKENGEFVWPFARNVLENLEKIKRGKGISQGATIGFMTACRWNETSVLFVGDHYSLFTKYLVAGFTSGDANGDGNVTFMELFDYASPRALQDNPEQHAQSDNDALLSATIAAGSGPAPTSDYRVLAGGDYNGDEYDDIAIFRPSSGLWSVRGVTRVYWGTSGDIPVPGNYGGYGKTDIGIFRPSSGLWALKGYLRYYYGTSSDIPVPGDYDGNGACNLGIYRPSSGLWSIWNLTRVYFGGSSDKPAPADYSGDNTTEMCIFRESSGLWACRSGWRTYYGRAGDIPVPMDTTGNGRCGPAIYRSSSGLWSVQGWSRIYFGGSSDQPVPADYQGGIADEIAIFRPSAGLWAIRNGYRYYYGRSGDIPVTR